MDLVALLQIPRIQTLILSHLSISDLRSLRLTSSSCCLRTTKHLFTTLTIPFSTDTFRPSRVASLTRIGPLVERLVFSLPHSPRTLLPPLIDRTGDPLLFVYDPQRGQNACDGRLVEALRAQYPPLFHAATNVAAFVGGMRHMTRVRDLTILCPGKTAGEGYSRSVVDYALVSVRMAVERAGWTALSGLQVAVHAGGFAHLRPVGSIGSGPAGGRRWSQIRRLRVSVEGPEPGPDQRKVMEDYMRWFAPRLHEFASSCPLALTPRRQLEEDSGRGVGRNVEQESLHRMLAVDPEARARAVRKAKEAVLAKLSAGLTVKPTGAVSACRRMMASDIRMQKDG